MRYVSAKVINECLPKGKIHMIGRSTARVVTYHDSYGNECEVNDVNMDSLMVEMKVQVHITSAIAKTLTIHTCKGCEYESKKKTYCVQECYMAER